MSYLNKYRQLNYSFLLSIQKIVLVFSLLFFIPVNLNANDNIVSLYESEIRSIFEIMTGLILPNNPSDIDNTGRVIDGAGFTYNFQKNGKWDAYRSLHNAWGTWEIKKNYLCMTAEGDELDKLKEPPTLWENCITIAANFEKGYLVGKFNNYNSTFIIGDFFLVRRSARTKILHATAVDDSLKVLEKICSALGFTMGTETYDDCVMQLRR